MDGKGAPNGYGSLANAGALLTGITLASYVLGWVRFRSYYSSFGASWITSEAPVSSIVSNGALPVVFLVVSYSVSLYALDDLEEEGNPLVHIFVFGLATVLLFGVSLALSRAQYHTVAVQASRATLLLLSFCLCAGVGYAVRSLDLTQWSVRKDLITLGIGTALVYLIGTGTLGTIEGRKAKDPTASDLSWVVVADTNRASRLVLTNDFSVYVASLRSNGRDPRVEVLEPEDTEFISQTRPDSVLSR